MAIYLGGETAVEKRELDDLTPRQIVAELDRYVVGQNAAKKAVAVALRNRIRRQKLPAEIAEDVLPKNILMIGSTGVGMNNFQDGSVVIDEKEIAFASNHPGGAQFAYADGHVALLHSSIDRAVYSALGTRAGGEVVRLESP